jgi:hypothetical protein
LPGKKGSPEFNPAYDALIAGALILKPPRRAKRPKSDAPGTIGWFAEKYLTSDYFVVRDGREPFVIGGWWRAVSSIKSSVYRVRR